VSCVCAGVLWGGRGRALPCSVCELFAASVECGVCELSCMLGACVAWFPRGFRSTSPGLWRSLLRFAGPGICLSVLSTQP
jgi:hypothetical protein